MSKKKKSKLFFINKDTEKNESAPKEKEPKAKQPKQSAVLKNNIKIPDGMHRAMPIILFAAAVFTGISFIIGDIGTFGNFLSNLLLGLFSYAAYIIPVLIALHAIFYASDLKENRILTRLIFSLIAVGSMSSAIYTIENWREKVDFLGWQYYSLGTSLSGGGLAGGVLGYCLTHLFGYIGMIIIALMVLAVYFTYFFSGKSTLKRIGYVVLKKVVTMLATWEKNIKQYFNSRVRTKAPAKKNFNRKKIEEKQRELYDDDFFDVDNGIERLEITELGIKEERSRESIEARPTLHEKVFHKSDVKSSKEHKNDNGIYVFDDDENGKSYADKNADKENESDTFTYVSYESQKAEVKDNSADAVFTKSFDPFDIALSSELANKPSSKLEKEAPTVKENISEITNDDLERARQRAEFEARKAELLRQAQEREAAKARQEEIARQSTFERKTVLFNESTDSYKNEPEIEDDFTATIDKNEENSHYYSNDYTEEDTTTVTHRSVNAYESAEYNQNSSYYEEEKPISLFSFDDNEQPETLTVERTMLGSDEKSEEYDFVTEAEEYYFDSEAEEYDESEDDVLPEEISPENQNPVINQYRDMFTMFRNEEKTDEAETIADDGSDAPFDVNNKEPLPFEEEKLFPFEIEKSEPAFIQKQPEPNPSSPVKEKPQGAKADYSKYKMPPIDLLGLDPIQNDDEISQEINQNTNTLIETLASFNVTASIKGVDRGPRITRYEVVPARGVKVNAITNLFDDIALNLAAEGIRMEAPIPGKSAIGFEIPNKRPSNVRLRELLECEEFINAKSTTFVCIGKDVAGNPVFGDIAKFPHALVAGATGMGKSVCINSIMISILYKARPDEVKFIMIDPKKVEFKMYSGIPHLLIPVITEAKQAAGALMWAVEEMERRYSIIEQLNIRNIEVYNEKCAIDKSIGEPMPKIVIVIDELNDLMMQVRDPVEDLIMRIAQKARAAGIHLIIGTQRPDVKVVTGTIKANINTRISCKVTSVVDSRTILEMAGAEKLLNRGDMLFKPVDKTKPIRVQGCFVSDPEVEAIMNFLKAECDGNIYDDEVFAEINRAAQKCGNKRSQGGLDDDTGDGDSEVGYYNDQQFLDAVELAIRSGKVSTSLLQRKLSIGYGKAAKYIDAMEDLGIVSEQNGQKPRDVLLSMDEWHEKLTRVSFDD